MLVASKTKNCGLQGVRPPPPGGYSVSHRASQVANGVCRLWWMEKARVVSLLFGSNHFVKVRTDFMRVRFQDDSLSYGLCACHIHHGGIRPMSPSLLGYNKLLF